MLSSAACHRPLLCMMNKEHHDAHIDFPVKYTLRASVKTKGHQEWDGIFYYNTDIGYYVQSREPIS